MASNGKKDKKEPTPESKRTARTFSIPLHHPHGYSLIMPGKVLVPKEMEIPIFLIRNELRSKMLFNVFQELGFDHCYYETYLDRLILASLRMWDGTDETFNFYLNLMMKWSENVTPDIDVATRRAIKIYHALIKYRDNRRK